MRIWLKEKKPNRAEELATFANEYVQSRKGPLIDGKFVESEKKIDAAFKHTLANVKQARERHRNNIDSKFRPSQDRVNNKSNVKCFNCQEKGHYAHECRVRKKFQSGACLGMAPLGTILGNCSFGKVNGKNVRMIIDSGCSRTLVHEKFVNGDYYTGESITIITANGDRVEVPLAWVSIQSKQGIYNELVGVMKNLPVDCLLGRSSYGKSLVKENLLEHWEQAVNSKLEPELLDNSTNDLAYVVTRRQAALLEAQTRLDKLTDNHNELAIKTLSPQESKNHELSEDIELRILFETNSKMDGEKTDVSSELKSGQDFPDQPENLPQNILDRSRTQLIQDQKEDVTLRILNISNLAPESDDGYYYKEGVLFHRKFTEYPHNGISYIDRVVAPEAYRPEILRVGHSMPIAGHMGQEKSYQRVKVSRYFFGCICIKR